MRNILLLLAGLMYLKAPAPILAVDWRPVIPEELARKTPKLEPGADAEAIFWDVHIEDRLSGGDLSLSLNHYVRIKIYTERGKERFATIEIPRYGKHQISEVAARTLKTGGSIVDVKKDSIFDRELVKTKGAKISGITFAAPGLEAGDIIEYRYRETRKNEVADHMRLYFQRELPMWTVTYHVKPLQVPWLPYSMRSLAFQCNVPAFEKEAGGFYSTSLHDVPAFKEEPAMPPEDNLRAWALIYYEEDRKLSPEQFWKQTGKQDYVSFKPWMKIDGLVKSTAAEIVGGIGKPADRLVALETFCRTKVKHVNSSPFEMAAGDRKKVKENRSPGETLKQMAGEPIDINLLFAALAGAAGFEARMARVADRGDAFFSPKLATTYFLRCCIVAVGLEGKWVFLDPASQYLESGMLAWQQEGVKALVSDPKEGFFADTEFSDAYRSRKIRHAEFKLLEDGTIEGKVRYTLTGHSARDEKLAFTDSTPQQRDDAWKERLQARLSSAELSDLRIPPIDPGGAMSVSYAIRVPGYALRTGKRILIQPAFFERNGKPPFAEPSRKWAIYFHYTWSEDDDVYIDLPSGWVLDKPLVPRNSTLGGMGEYRVEVLKTSDGQRLIYKRHFYWGKDGKILLPAAAYPQLRTVFDFIRQQDDYVVTLVPGKEASSAN